MDDTKVLTDAEIVALLRDDDPKKVQDGLTALYPAQSVSLVKASAFRNMQSTAKGSNAHLLFTALLWAAQKMGESCGMHILLANAQAKGPAVVVPPGMK